MRVLNRVSITVFLLVAVANQVLAKDAIKGVPPFESVLLLQVDGSLEVDPQGRVSDYSVVTALPGELGAALGRIVNQWRFEPLIIDGVPHQSSWNLRVILAAKQVAGKYIITIDNVVFPPNSSNLELQRLTEATPPITGKRLTPPLFPSYVLWRARVSCKVLLNILVAADGRVEQVTANQTMLFDVKGSPADLKFALKKFESEAVRAAHDWTFNIAANRGRMPVAARTVAVPVEFSFKRDPDAAGVWRSIVRTPMRRAEWLPVTPDTGEIGVADVDSDEVVPATGGGALKLTTDVRGTPVL